MTLRERAQAAVEDSTRYAAERQHSKLVEEQERLTILLKRRGILTDGDEPQLELTDCAKCTIDGLVFRLHRPLGGFGDQIHVQRLCAQCTTRTWQPVYDLIQLGVEISRRDQLCGDCQEQLRPAPTVGEQMVELIRTIASEVNQP